MRLRYLILYVADVPAAIDFYERAFGLSRLMLLESGDYGELATGDTKLAMASRELITSLGKSPRPAEAGRPTFELAFEVEEVAGAYARAVEAGATPVQPPREEPWGQVTSYVSDPDGYLVELCSPVG